MGEYNDGAPDWSRFLERAMVCSMLKGTLPEVCAPSLGFCNATFPSQLPTSPAPSLCSPMCPTFRHASVGYFLGTNEWTVYPRVSWPVVGVNNSRYCGEW